MLVLRKTILNLYLLQGLPEDQFASANVLVRKKCPNLVEVELGGEFVFPFFLSISFFTWVEKWVATEAMMWPMVKLPEWNWSKIFCQ